jgi:hypothetical protein
MRAALALLVMIAAGSTFEPAQADQYKWCAAYGGSEEGSYNCYFVTLQQCQAAVSGVGGFCMPSPFASTPPLPTQRKKKQS